MKQIFAHVGGLIFRYRNGVFPLVLGSLLIVFPPGLGPLFTALDGIGLALCLLGQGLRIAVIGYAYIVRGGKQKKVYADTLVTTGFFALSRNPLYLGNLLIYCGLLLLQGSLAASIIGTLFFIAAYRSIVAAEEAYLIGKFGSTYEDYCRRVNRWWPSNFRIKPAIAGMQFNFGRVVIKDYSTLGAWILGVLLIFGSQSIEANGWAGARSDLSLMFKCIAGLLMLLGFARLAKKQRWITE